MTARPEKKISNNFFSQYTISQSGYVTLTECCHATGDGSNHILVCTRFGPNRFGAAPPAEALRFVTLEQVCVLAKRGERESRAQQGCQIFKLFEINIKNKIYFSKFIEIF